MVTSWLRLQNWIGLPRPSLRGLEPNLHMQCSTLEPLCQPLDSPRHITVHAHQEVLAKHHIDHMVPPLRQAGTRERESELLREGHDWMCTPAWNAKVTECFEAIRMNDMVMEDDSNAECWACPECDSFFSSAAALKVQRVHGIQNQPPKTFCRSRHALRRLPTLDLGIHPETGGHSRPGGDQDQCGRGRKGTCSCGGGRGSGTS